MSKEEFYLKLFDKGLEVLKMLIPALVALHMPQPKYMNHKKKADESSEESKK